MHCGAADNQCLLTKQYIPSSFSRRTKSVRFVCSQISLSVYRVCHFSDLISTHTHTDLSRLAWKSNLFLYYIHTHIHPHTHTHIHTEAIRIKGVMSSLVSLCDPASNRPVLTEPTGLESQSDIKEQQRRKVSPRTRRFDAIFIHAPLTHYLNKHGVECLETWCAFKIEWKTNWREGKLQQWNVAAMRKK